MRPSTFVIEVARTQSGKTCLAIADCIRAGRIPCAVCVQDFTTPSMTFAGIVQTSTTAMTNIQMAGQGCNAAIDAFIATMNNPVARMQECIAARIDRATPAAGFIAAKDVFIAAIGFFIAAKEVIQAPPQGGGIAIVDFSRPVTAFIAAMNAFVAPMKPFKANMKGFAATAQGRKSAIGCCMRPMKAFIDAMKGCIASMKCFKAAMNTFIAAMMVLRVRKRDRVALRRTGGDATAAARRRKHHAPAPSLDQAPEPAHVNPLVNALLMQCEHTEYVRKHGLPVAAG